MAKLNTLHRNTLALSTAPTHYYRANCQGNTPGYAVAVTPSAWANPVANTAPKANPLAVLRHGLAACGLASNGQALATAPTKYNPAANKAA